jgi:ligand-binding sensor domain-containing protein/tRNA A-37 threonylcarbamoyl transferase component Bud32
MSDLVGQTLGAYRVLEQLGVGGMATVFKAYQPAMDRYVAIKVLPQHLARDPNFRARFDREARTIARLEHRHILPVYDVGDADGIPFLVMRFTESGTLSDMIAAGRLSPGRAVELAAQIGEALTYAHSQGVIHRDIKPANVLISREGDALLSDFGIAKIYEDSMQLTGEGVMVGTPYYMAPEQVQGRPADARSDIYALGVILYESVTGRRPFEAETPLAVALKHMHDPLPLPRSIAPDLPEALERIILKALAKNADDRFQSAAEMVTALRSLPAEALTAVAAPAPATVVLPSGAVHPSAPETTPTPTTAAPAPTPPTPPAPAARRPGWLAPAAIGAVAVVLLLIVAGVVRRDRDAPSTAEQPPATSAAGQVAVPGSLPAGPTLEPLANLTVFGDTTRTETMALLGGYAWVATGGGLVRYDAAGAARVFTVADGLPFNAATSIAAAPDGSLWLGGYYRIARIRPVADGIGEAAVYYAEDGMLVGRINAIMVDADGSVWAAGADGEEPLVRFDGERWAPPLRFDDSALADIPLALYDLKRDTAGALWLGAYGAALRWDGAQWTVFPIEREGERRPLYELLALPDQGMLGILDYGLARFLPAEERWEPVAVLDAGRSYLSLLARRDGSIWALGYSGIAQSADGGGAWQEVRLPANGIGYELAAAVEDADGQVWIGADIGVTRFDGSDFARLDAPGRLEASVFSEFIATPGGDQLCVVPLWGGQPSLIDINSLEVAPFPLEGRIYSVAFSPDTIWAATNDGVVALENGSQYSISTDDGLPTNDIRALLATPDALYIGTAAGLAIYRFDDDTINSVPEFDGTIVSDLLLAPDDTVWAGAHRENDVGFGLLGWNTGDEWEFWGQGDLPSAEDPAEVFDIAADSEGGIWLVTGQYDAGIYRFDGTEWSGWRERDGAPLGDARTVTAAGDTVVVAGTLYGEVAIFDGTGWRTEQVDGLTGEALDLFVDNNGAVWLATDDGLVRVVRS